MILRDNWQGEFSVALFGAIGWAIISLFSGTPLGGLPIYDILTRIAPEFVWELAMLGFGGLQLFGLRTDKTWPRVIGAFGVFVIFVCILLAMFLADPGTRSIGFCLASICIEFCAIVFQTARIVRTGEGLAWPWTYKP